MCQCRVAASAAVCRTRGFEIFSGKKLSCEDAEKLKAVEGGKFRIPMARLEIEAEKI